MSFPRTFGWVAAAWAVVLGGYALAIVVLRPGQALTSFGDVVQCFVPLLANTGLLLNAGAPHWRRNVFWMLLALGCMFWMFGQFQWTYYEVYLRKPLPQVYLGDMVFFLRGIPVMAALALRPHHRRGDLRLRFGYLDFVLLLMWWIFLYVFFVFPWMYATPSASQYNYNYLLLANIQNLIIILAIAWFWLRTRGAWRKVYTHLFGAAATYMLSSMAINAAIAVDRYRTGSLYDLPLLASFLWYGTTGVVAYHNREALDAPGGLEPMQDESEVARREGIVASRLATTAVLSLPFFALWTIEFSKDSSEVREFRLLVTVVAMVPLAFLVFLRQHLADSDRLRLLERTEQSMDNLQRLQAQLVQSEKLVSLGQLAAGAAHEINNPLTAILGFSDLLVDDASIPEKARTTAAKIRDQARRTKTLVANLLSFARQAPSERTLLDINTVVTNAAQLRGLDLKGSTSIELRLESVLPGVRGDGNQLMQVFFNIISNAIDAMEPAGGVLTIKTQRDRSHVVVLFSDTGSGLKDPLRVFDPFYTTKPVGKGTGLGLSICYGLIQEHGGRIICYNRPEGGAVFRVDLPSVTAALPSREPQLPVTAGAGPSKDA